MITHDLGVIANKCDEVIVMVRRAHLRARHGPGNLYK
jgi:ABC-type Mn2+/Zn2+ transport system ATPase subunit